MKKITLFTIVFLVNSLLFSQSANAAVEPCKQNASHWRDLAYTKAPMNKYAKYKSCIAWVAYQFELPEELLYSIIYVERGDVSGKCSVNRNKTKDCGPAQINDVRVGELSRFGLTRDDIQKKPCHNIWAMGYLIRREIEKANGDIWRGVGNYHYNYRASPKIHMRYVNKIQAAWNELVTSTKVICSKKSK